MDNKTVILTDNDGREVTADNWAMIYQNPSGWYWMLHSFRRPVGPFKTLKETYENCSDVMELH